MPEPKSIKAFLEKHRLPVSYAAHAQSWFDPLAEQVASHQLEASRPIAVGIHGCQGSGKSTLADYLCFYLAEVKHLSTASVSLDDFYLTHAERQQLATSVHPLLGTRGVPGTHDVALAVSTLRSLTNSDPAETFVPRFDKANDDRKQKNQWDRVRTPADVVIFEGWCLGVTAQTAEDLKMPINALERDEDPQGIWRSYVNQQLLSSYPQLWDTADLWIMLKAPSFDCVYQWRVEQENKLAQSGSQGKRIMTEQQLSRFIQHYQRLTEHALNTLPERVNFLFELDGQRQIVASHQPVEIE